MEFVGESFHRKVKGGAVRTFTVLHGTPHIIAIISKTHALSLTPLRDSPCSIRVREREGLWDMRPDSRRGRCSSHAVGTAR